MKVHFIGVGGIGVSALAQYYLSQGAEVSGSDLVSSEITDLLKKRGVRIIIGKHKSKNVPQDAVLVVYSPAVLSSNPELKRAIGLGAKSLSYPEALGELTKQYFTIAVSGAHGKSTTTSMIALVLSKAGLDPTVVVGTKIKEFDDSNFRAGKGRYLVIEADEWNASFLSYWPHIIVLTNIEREHLDYYKNLDHILKTFKEYIGHLPKDGILVINKEDKNIAKIQDIKPRRTTKAYSLKQLEAVQIGRILKIPGKHNISNALAALTVARILGVPDAKTFKALSEYQGVWRRFDISKKIIVGRAITLINDYGHHPTEIIATLKAAREKFPDNRIWCVFQPHQYQRTFNLFKDFVIAFRRAPIDRIIITDIYSVAGREKADIKRRVDSKRLVEAINNKKTSYLAKNKVVGFLKGNIKSDDVIIMMGAGDIYDLNKDL